MRISVRISFGCRAVCQKPTKKSFAVIDRDPRFQRWMELHTPNGQVPSADVCGGAAVYLCSDFAGHVHGQMLLVDGGMSVWQQPDMPDSWT